MNLWLFLLLNRSAVYVQETKTDQKKKEKPKSWKEKVARKWHNSRIKHKQRLWKALSLRERKLNQQLRKWTIIRARLKWVEHPHTNTPTQPHTHKHRTSHTHTKNLKKKAKSEMALKWAVKWNWKQIAKTCETTNLSGNLVSRRVNTGGKLK